jgi:anti-sigma B factor antagonist
MATASVGPISSYRAVAAMTELDTTVEEHDRYVRVQLRGELDMATVAAFERVLARAEALSPRPLVLDLRALEFLDSSGLFAVIKASERAKTDGQRLVIVPGPSAVQYLFEVTMLDQRLEFVDGPECV